MTIPSRGGDDAPDAINPVQEPQLGAQDGCWKLERIYDRAWLWGCLNDLYDCVPIL